jgi:hypothetical protein
MLRFLLTTFFLATGFINMNAIAANKLDLQIIKTGILPAGGFYRIYEVACHEQAVANVVSLRKTSDWCVNDSGTLTCFSDSQQASHTACAAEGTVASAERVGEELVVN